MNNNKIKVITQSKEIKAIQLEMNIKADTILFITFIY